MSQLPLYERIIQLNQPLINVWFKNGILIVCAPIYMSKQGLTIVMQNKANT